MQGFRSAADWRRSGNPGQAYPSRQTVRDPGSTSLTPAATVPGGLFDAPDGARAKARMQAVDKLNGRYGRDTVRFAATGVRRPWKLRRDFISPRYTTCWDELLTVPGGAGGQGAR